MLIGSNEHVKNGLEYAKNKKNLYSMTSYPVVRENEKISKSKKSLELLSLRGLGADQLSLFASCEVRIRNKCR
jgi:hypothetical protein